MKEQLLKLGDQLAFFLLNCVGLGPGFLLGNCKFYFIFGLVLLLVEGFYFSVFWKFIERFGQIIYLRRNYFRRI